MSKIEEARMRLDEASECLESLRYRRLADAARDYVRWCEGDLPDYDPESLGQAAREFAAAWLTDKLRALEDRSGPPINGGEHS